MGSGRCPSGETSKFCFRWPSGEPEMIFLCPDQAPGQLRIFCMSRICLYSRERVGPCFTFSRKSDFQRNLNIPLHQKDGQHKFIINPESFIDFYVTRVKLHFGEFSNLTFQAVSWSQLLSKSHATLKVPCYSQSPMLLSKPHVTLKVPC